MQRCEALRRAALAHARSAGLTGARPGAFLRAVAFDYAVLAACLAALASAYGSWHFVWLAPLAWLVIASRQHALLILMHDATHGLAHPNRRANEWLGELLCAAPMGVSMATYRSAHLAHHRAANTSDDPDWVRKLEDADEAASWQFPLQERAAVGLARLWWRSVKYLMRSLAENSGAEGGQGPAPGIVRARLLFYAGVVVVLSVSGAWGWLVLGWLVPLILVLPLIMRLRSIAEHFALDYATELSGSRTVRAGWLERFLLAPHQVNYHLDHHLVASVSFAHVEALHDWLRKQPEFARHATINEGYFVGRAPLIRALFVPG